MSPSDVAYIFIIFVLIITVAAMANVADPNSECNDLNTILGID